MLILAVSLVVLAVGADNYWPTGGLRLPGEIGNLVIKGTKITMQQPRLTGYTSDARPYEFTADTAQQDITKPDFVELQQIHAKIAMADKSIVHLWADTGHYNMKTDMLDLKDNIHLVSSTGYEARLSHGDSRRWQGQCGFQHARLGEAARRRSQRQSIWKSSTRATHCALPT